MLFKKKNHFNGKKIRTDWFSKKVLFMTIQFRTLEKMRPLATLRLRLRSLS